LRAHVALEKRVPCIYLSKAKLKTLDATLSTLVTVELKLDCSRYGMPMPKELDEYLKQDSEARRCSRRA